jgi:HAD superfamily hydrolase (TIGR01509 family)
MPARDMRKEIEAELGRPLPDDHETNCAAELYALFRRELKPVDGISEIVAALVATAHPRCVASSSSPERIALALSTVGIHDQFWPNIFSSTMVARGKPAPDLFLYAANALGFAPDHCVVVEDSANGVRAARSAGMLPIAFLGGTHCPATHHEDLSRAGASRVCCDAAELVQVLSEVAGFRPHLP